MAHYVVFSFKLRHVRRNPLNASRCIWMNYDNCLRLTLVYTLFWFIHGILKAILFDLLIVFFFIPGVVNSIGLFVWSISQKQIVNRLFAFFISWLYLNFSYLFPVVQHVRRCAQCKTYEISSGSDELHPWITVSIGPPLVQMALRFWMVQQQAPVLRI